MLVLVLFVKWVVSNIFRAGLKSVRVIPALQQVEPLWARLKMTDSNDLFFELSDSGDFVKLEPLERINYDSNIDWDKNWVKTIVTVKGGRFSGTYPADFMTVDFANFKRELSALYDNLDGSAQFYDVEGYLDLKIKGDGIGHFEVDIKACDEPGANASELTFTMTFDQTQIKGLVRQLELITNQYPIVGDFEIRDK